VQQQEVSQAISVKATEVQQPTSHHNETTVGNQKLTYIFKKALK